MLHLHLNGVDGRGCRGHRAHPFSLQNSRAIIAQQTDERNCRSFESSMCRRYCWRRNRLDRGPNGAVGGCSPYAAGASGSGWCCGLPGPAALDFKHEGPAQESADQHEAGEQAEAHRCQFVRDGFDDASRRQALPLQQQRPADPYPIGLGIHLGHKPRVPIGRPGDARDDDKDAKNLDAVADDADLCDSTTDPHRE